MRDGPPVAGTLGGGESSLDQKQGGPRGASREERPDKPGGAARLDSRADALLAVQRPSTTVRNSRAATAKATPSAASIARSAERAAAVPSPRPKDPSVPASVCASWAATARSGGAI